MSEFLGAEEACKYIAKTKGHVIGRRQLRRETQHGNVQAIKIGNAYGYSRKGLDKYKSRPRGRKPGGGGH
jgi:hypothetical protein